MVELPALKAKRDYFKTKLIRGEKFVAGFGDSQDIEQLKILKASLEVTSREFDEVQLQIDILNPNDESLDLKFKNFETTYFKVITAINHLFKRRSIAALDPHVDGTSRIDSNKAESNQNRESSKTSCYLSAVAPSYPETSDNTAINLDKDGDIKTLALTWNFKEDTLRYAIANSPIPGKITKRSILSTIAKIFDSLGLIAPFVVNAKLVLQKLWELKLQWDQSVPNPLAEEWHRFLNELCHLSNLNIIRKVIPQVPVTLLEIHVSLWSSYLFTIAK
jgi:hypothetical protein